MMFKPSPSTRALLASFIICNLAAKSHGENNIVEHPFEFQTLKIAGGGSTPATMEAVSVDDKEGSSEALQLTLAHSLDRNTTLTIPVEDVNGDEFNTLTFKVRFPAVQRRIAITVQDAKGNWAATQSPKHTRDLGDGWYAFEWDMVYKPDTDNGVDFSNLNKIHFALTNSDIPSGELETVLIKDLKLVSGKRAQTGDPALFDKWREFARSYEPDYSDSSTALLPPKEGRLKSPLSLVSNGRALGEIVLASQASEVEQNAAKELQHWLKQISGVELAIVEQSTGADKVGIYVGRTFADSAYQKDIEFLGETDGYAVRNEGKKIFIFGAIPKGTLNGVFAFLEKNTDIIWARPHTDYGTIFSKDPKLQIVWGDAIDKPAGRIRGWLANAGGTPGCMGIWGVRNQTNYGWRIPEWGEMLEVGGGHNLQVYIPQNDPAYYPVVNGARPEKISIWKHQICMSVPDLAKTYAENVLKWIVEKKHQNANIVNIKIEDNWGVCECEQCVAPIVLPGGERLESTDPAFRSTQFFKFLNEVTERVTQVHPGKMIQTYAYFFTATPPKVDVHKNIWVLFCPYVRKDHRTPLFSPVNDHWWNVQKTWAEKTPNVVVREYYGIFNEGRPLAEVVAADIREKVKQGVTRYLSETFDDDRRIWWDGAIRGEGDEYDVNMMDHWVINRIYWNPDADVEDLRKYFIRRTFREAAPEMERVFGMVREGWFTKRGSSTWGGGVLHNAFVKSGREGEVRQLLETASQKVQHPTSRILVARVKERIEKNYLPAKPEILVHRVKNSDGKDTIVPTCLFEYGWTLPAYRTTVEKDGAFKTAIRVRFSGNKMSASTLMYLSDMSNSTIRYRVTRVSSSPNIDPTILPLLKLMTGPGVVMPNEAYTKNADGSYNCEWTPVADIEAKPKVDLSRVGRALIEYPAPALGEDEFVEFLITDWVVTRNEGAGETASTEKS